MVQFSCSEYICYRAYPIFFKFNNIKNIYFISISANIYLALAMMYAYVISSNSHKTQFCEHKIAPPPFFLQMRKLSHGKVQVTYPRLHR